MTPIAAGLILLWYSKREESSWRKLSFKPRYIVIAPIIVACLVWLSYVGLLYRGESGVSAFAEAMSLTGFWQHIQGSVFVDLGQLHSLAGAVAIGPGVLNGDTFYGSLSWPLSSVLPIPGAKCRCLYRGGARRIWKKSRKMGGQCVIDRRRLLEFRSRRRGHCDATTGSFA